MEKRINILLPIFVMACLFSIGCQNDNVTSGETQTSEKKKASVKSLPPLNKLKKINKQTYSFIRHINSKKVRDEKQPILVTGKNLIIKGTAIDKPRKRAAAGVYLRIGNQTFRTQHGAPNKILAKRLNNENYLNSSFTANIPVAKLKKGIQEITVLIVSYNRKGYYIQKEKIKIRVQ